MKNGMTKAKAAEEATKSPEQKEFEKMQTEGLKAAEEYATKAKMELLKMGYAYKPAIQHIDSRRPDVVAAQVLFVPLEFDEWSKAMDVVAKKENPAPETEQKEEEEVVTEGKETQQEQSYEEAGGANK